MKLTAIALGFLAVGSVIGPAIFYLASRAMKHFAQKHFDRGASARIESVATESLESELARRPESNAYRNAPRKRVENK